MRKAAVALGAAICLLVAEPFAIAAAVALVIFQSVLTIGRGNRPGAGDAKAYEVYRYDFDRHVRESIGTVWERRRRERGNNYRDLLNRARNLFSASSSNSLVLLSPD